MYDLSSLSELPEIIGLGFSKEEEKKIKKVLMKTVIQSILSLNGWYEFVWVLL